MKEQVTGWGNPRPLDSKGKFHDFGKDGRSLCGKWGRFAGEPKVEDSMDDHEDNCAECKRKVGKYRAMEVKR